MACTVIQSRGIVATGSDVTPTTPNWTDISAAGPYVSAAIVSPTGVSNSETIAAIDTPVTFRAAFTTVGDAVHLSWVKSGVVQGFAASPRDVNFVSGAALVLQVRFANNINTPAFASGVITITNLSDGGASIDTLNYELERF